MTIRDVETLELWIAAARETGLVAFDTETTSLDPMQAELVGVSLAIQDNVLSPGSTDIRAAYIPLTHKTGAGDLLGGGHADGQIPMKEAPCLLVLLEDKSVLKIAQNLQYDCLVMTAATA